MDPPKSAKRSKTFLRDKNENEKWPHGHPEGISHQNVNSVYSSLWKKRSPPPLSQTGLYSLKTHLQSSKYDSV
jgi:hypothetical protein